MLFITQIGISTIIILLTVLTIIYSTSLLNALNDSLSIIVLVNLNTMASKLFIMELSGYYNNVYTRKDYLDINMNAEEYKPTHFTL